jgi:hypothetical protein
MEKIRLRVEMISYRVKSVSELHGSRTYPDAQGLERKQKGFSHFSNFY